MQIYPVDYTFNNEGPVSGTPFFCNICGRTAAVKVHNYQNLREDCHCSYCNSFNRQRQLVQILLTVIYGNPYGRSLQDLTEISHLSLFNTECHGQVHEYLKANLSPYTWSEFLDQELASGDVVDGVMHQDLHALSFEDESFDIVLSSDVFEHLPDPYTAFQEVQRVLKVGGRHIFTVPFHQLNYLDDKRAEILNGELVHYKEPIYHDDAINPHERWLVYNIFSMEMLVNLERMGLLTKIYVMSEANLGIWGANCLVFESIRQH